MAGCEAIKGGPGRFLRRITAIPSENTLRNPVALWDGVIKELSLPWQQRRTNPRLAMKQVQYLER